ncbi:MAG: inositol monophosphatase family protein [Hyphomonadaceae bacterium]|nr:inositol monophosphatase family protein [Hyphomonadaceae bacterium]
MTKSPPFDAVGIAQAMADAARSAILPHYRALTHIDNKENGAAFDPVTEADQAGERAMRAVLEDLRPEDAIFGEEYGRKAGTSGWTWVLDPIDGTRAFVAGLPTWTSLIGLTNEDGDAVVGVIDQPNLDERYVGTPDGSRLISSEGETQLSISTCDDLRDAVISTTDPFILTPPEQGAWTHLRHTAKIIRYGLDAYAYARVAAGTIDLVAESGLAPYDAAALIPVVRGAGGLACDWRGNPAKPGGQLVCAASQGILDQALISLRRSAE